MTTIATDGKSMAGDGRCCDSNGGITSDRYTKIFRLNDGSLAGFAGSAFDRDVWLEWLNSDRSGRLEDVYEKAEAVVLTCDGRAFVYNHKGRSFEADLPYATGSGCEYARGAMMAGLTAEEAVHRAIRADSASGGTITVLHLEPAMSLVAGGAA